VSHGREEEGRGKGSLGFGSGADQGDGEALGGMHTEEERKERKNFSSKKK